MENTREGSIVNIPYNLLVNCNQSNFKKSSNKSNKKSQKFDQSSMDNFIEFQRKKSTNELRGYRDGLLEIIADS